MSNFKIGEKVVCINCNDILHPKEIALGCKNPIPNEIYTIREIIYIENRLSFRFEEIINPKIKYIDGYDECSYLSHNYRKLDHQFADDICAELVKQVKEEQLILS